MSPLASKRKRRCCVLSPSTKRIRKAVGKAIQVEAFKELLKLKALGQGRLQYGDMERLVKKYHEKGYPEVTRDNLNYCLKKLEGEHQKKDSEAKLAAERTKLIGVEIPEAVVVETSDLSGSSKSGGRPKGSTKAAANQQRLAIRMATADCVQLYLERKAIYGKRNVPNGTLESIVSKVESEAGLPEKTISRHTVRH
jgi:hypothetical protein